jgi:hypothetical protein
MTIIPTTQLASLRGEKGKNIQIYIEYISV